MRDGFTLMEVTMVITIALVLAVVTIPFYGRLQDISVVGAVRGEVLQNVRYAQTKAMSGERNSAFGVYFETTQYTIYQGDSFATRDSGHDLVFSGEDNFEFTETEVNFELKTGLPDSADSITITNIATDRTDSVQINNAGLIQ